MQLHRLGPVARYSNLSSYQVSVSVTHAGDSRIGDFLIHLGKQISQGFFMASPIPLRSDFEAGVLRKLARQSRDPDQTRRLLALAEIYDGGSRSDAARIGGVGLRSCGIGFCGSTPRVRMAL